MLKENFGNWFAYFIYLFFIFQSNRAFRARRHRPTWRTWGSFTTRWNSTACLNSRKHRVSFGNTFSHVFIQLCFPSRVFESIRSSLPHPQEDVSAVVFDVQHPLRRRPSRFVSKFVSMMSWSYLLFLYNNIIIICLIIKLLKCQHLGQSECNWNLKFQTRSRLTFK